MLFALFGTPFARSSLRQFNEVIIHFSSIYAITSIFSNLVGARKQTIDTFKKLSIHITGRPGMIIASHNYYYVTTVEKLSKLPIATIENTNICIRLYLHSMCQWSSYGNYYRVFFKVIIVLHARHGIVEFFMLIFYF